MTTSRRQFILAAAATGGTALLPHALTAQRESVPPADDQNFPILVDWHSHVITEGEIRYLAGRSEAPRVLRGAGGEFLMQNVTTVSAVARDPSATSPSDIDVRVQHLDANGVGRQLLTYTVAQGYDATLPVEELRVFFRTLNDDLAAIIRKYPGRFLGVAALPTADPRWAAEELDRAHRELGLIGAALPMNAFTTLEGARTLAPIFAAGQRLNSHFFIHRAPASNLVPGQPPLVVPSDTDTVRWSVISNSHLVNGAITLGLTDFLDPYPDVSVQVIMLGGFLPYLIDSIISSGSQLGISDPLARLRRIYLEPGPYSSTRTDWVQHAVSRFGADRILFGTDYGVGGGVSADRLGTSIAALNAVIPGHARRQIYEENSRDLLRAKGIA